MRFGGHFHLLPVPAATPLFDHSCSLRQLRLPALALLQLPAMPPV
jgi:hypothetical protein